MSNVSFAFTVEICKMNMAYVCGCGVGKQNFDEPRGTVSYNSGTCCSEETRIISNQTEFETIKNFKTDFQSLFAPILKPAVVLEPVFENIQLKTVLIFYSPPQDIPVFYSSLLI